MDMDMLKFIDPFKSHTGLSLDFVGLHRMTCFLLSYKYWMGVAPMWLWVVEKLVVASSVIYF